MTSTFAVTLASLECADDEERALRREIELLTPEQCRKARRLLKITQSALATHLQATQTVISVFERTGFMPRPLRGELDRLSELSRWFERAGVTFTNDGELGVKLRRAEQFS